MHKVLSKLFHCLSLGLILFIFSAEMVGQERSLRVIGTVENDMKPVPRARINLFKDGKSVDILFTKANGEFIFDLEINHEYLIEVSGTGYMTKRIAFNTEMPDDVFGRWTMEFAMSLFEGCEGVANTALNDPVDRIKYSTNKSDFISDNAYVQRMRGRIEGLLMDIDKCHDDKFQELVDQADELKNDNNPEEARQKYEEALKIFPDDKLTKRKVDELNKQIGVNEQNQQTYANALSEADRLYAEKQYIAARDKYNEAMRAIPQNNYPREKVAEIERILREKSQAEQAEVNANRKYESLITQGNAAYTAKNFVAAKTYYEQALMIKPEATYPQQRVSELGPAIEKQKQETLNKAAQDKAYNEAMSMGQNAMAQKDYALAKQHFSKALTIKPEESYPQQMMKEIDKALASQKVAQLKANKAATQAKIDDALDEGDAMYKAKNYAAAASAYQTALALDPNDSYAKDRLNKSKNLMAAADAEKQKALEKAHKEKIVKADALVAAASYQQAIAVYKQALLAKPNDVALQGKLADAEQKLAIEEQKKAATAANKQEYDKLLAEGNSYFTAKQYSNAKLAYNQALAIYPTQAYPRNKIMEIDAILAKNQKEQQYRGIITSADNSMAAKDYNQAKTLYQQALAVKSGDAYASQKITEIDVAISKQQQAAKQQATDQRYNQAILQADNLFNTKKYAEAKNAYQAALGIKPGESYPRTQMALIDTRVAEQTRLAEQQVIDQRYNQAILQADNLFNTKKYAEAKNAYQAALGIKPGETYPKTQMALIDTRVAEQTRLAEEQKATNYKYDEAIAAADRLYSQNNLEGAKTQYERALSFKPNETYPTGQIVKINGQLAQIDKTRQEKAAFEQRYQTVIASADNSYDRRDYPSAKAGYMQALSMKPGEAYPQQRLNKIAEFERIIAQKEAAQKAALAAATTSAASASISSPSKLKELNFANDSERDKYLNNLKKDYPQGVTLEMHKEKNSTTERYIVYRGNELREFRRIKFSWGGVEYSMNGKPITEQYFKTQVKTREGEYFKEIKL